MAMSFAQDKVVLKDMKTLYSSCVEMRDGKVYISPKNVVDISKVREIFFQVQAQKKPKTTLKGKPKDGTKKVVVPAEIQKIMTESKAFASKYRDAGVVILRNKAIWEYRKDATRVVTRHIRALIQKDEHKSISVGGDFFIDGREKVELLMARTIKKNGEVVPFDPKNVIISKPTMRGDTFISGSVFIFRLPEIEAGCIVEYKFRKTTYKPGKKEFFFPSFQFQSTYPMLSCVCQIIVPEKQKFYYHLKNFPKAKKNPVVKVESQKKTYTWKFENTAALVPEPSMPHLNDSVPSLYGTIFKDWNIIFNWLQKYYVPNCKPSAKLIAFTKKLVKDCKTEEEKVATIYHWVQKNIRYIIIKGDLSSIFGSYKCDVTFDRKFGCCVDKAVLFSGMLNAVNIKSTPIILNVTSGDDLLPNIPRIYLQHAISCVYLNGKRIYLDSTGYNSRYPSFGVTNQGVWCLNPMEKQLQFISQGSPETNVAKYITHVKLDSKGNCDVHWHTKYHGQYEAWIRGYWKNTNEFQRAQIFQRMCNGISPRSELVNYELYNLYDISKPFGMMKEYKIHQYPTFASDLVIFYIARP